MKIVAFDNRNRGSCPGCGMFDYGSHIGHRYTTSPNSNRMPNPAKFYAWCRRELGIKKEPTVEKAA